MIKGMLDIREKGKGKEIEVKPSAKGAATGAAAGVSVGAVVGGVIGGTQLD